MAKNNFAAEVTFKGEDTEDAYETFFTNCILKNNSVKTAFYTAVKNLRGEYKEQ